MACGKMDTLKTQVQIRPLSYTRKQHGDQVRGDMGSVASTRSKNKA
jgi:hypothetical protein